jgi:hypothetical protein
LERILQVLEDFVAAMVHLRSMHLEKGLIVLIFEDSRNLLTLGWHQVAALHIEVPNNHHDFEQAVID